MSFFFRQTAPAAMLGHVGADSLKKPHHIVTLSFSEVFFQVEVQANGLWNHFVKSIRLTSASNGFIHYTI